MFVKCLLTVEWEMLNFSLRILPKLSSPSGSEDISHEGDKDPTALLY